MGFENFESNSAAVQSDAVSALQAEFLASFEDPNPNRTRGDADSKRTPKTSSSDSSGSTQGPVDGKEEARQEPEPLDDRNKPLGADAETGTDQGPDLPKLPPFSRSPGEREIPPFSRSPVEPTEPIVFSNPYI